MFTYVDFEKLLIPVKSVQRSSQCWISFFLDIICNESSLKFRNGQLKYGRPKIRKLYITHNSTSIFPILKHIYMTLNTI